MASVIEFLVAFLMDHWLHLIVAVVGVPAIITVVLAIITAVLALIRHPKSSPPTAGEYLSADDLLVPPSTRPAYSDRMAYVLAELADLAYYRFEDSSFLSAAVTEAESQQTTNEMTAFLTQYTKDILSRRREIGRKILAGLLQDHNFELLDIIDIADTQGFVCKRIAKDGSPYVVLAFRGTEKKLADWLTDARCVPVVDGETKVHKGFHEAFTSTSNRQSGTVEAKVREVLSMQKAKDANGDPLPLFITGHSLGGALALLATRIVAPDVNGACYTFGSPRVANYEYFANVKTPVFRIVNSSDIVPRVPPGILMFVLVEIVKATSSFLQFKPQVAGLLNRLEAWLDKMNGYRHFGDLRYLSDVAEGRFHEVELLENPPPLDRAMWMWKRIAKSLLVPIHCHNMSIYRKKLQHIARERNT